MSLKNDAIPSSAAFDAIHQSLSSDPAEQKDAIKQGGAIFAFTIKNGSTTDSWHIDLKNKGVVGKGLSTEDGQKPQVTLQLSDADFQKLIEGKGNAQQMFMSGKLKVKGDVMKATKMEPYVLHSDFDTQARANEGEAMNANGSKHYVGT
ncbi:MAG: hypothetical protein M1831_001732 [Alyxoria varia]|nr:MAG: hypothetical protein M1831_001732 [Alyxoria varia]